MPFFCSVFLGNQKNESIKIEESNKTSMLSQMEKHYGKEKTFYNQYQTPHTMTTQAIANRLVELCREGKAQQAIAELYSSDITSVEPEGMPDRIVTGLAGIAEKGKKFQAMIEKIHSSSVSDPIVADNTFSCAMLMNVDMKGVPVPVDMNEICVYTVKDSKVIKEEFFYDLPPQTA